MQETQRIFEKIYGVESDDTPQSHRFTLRPTNPAIRQLTNTDKLPQAEHIRWNSVFLSSSHPGNSQIFVSLSRSSSSPMLIPARIVCIYVRRNQIHVAIRKQLPLENDTLTPYIRRRFPHFPLYFSCGRLSETLEEIPLDDVVSQYARWDIVPEEFSMLLDLSKVSYLHIHINRHF